MASGSSELPEALLNKYYKCHPNQKVGALVCCTCGDFHHTAEVVKKHNNGVPIKILDNTFIICQDHPNFALTSKLPYGQYKGPVADFIA